MCQAKNNFFVVDKMQVCYTIILNFISSRWAFGTHPRFRGPFKQGQNWWQRKSEIYGKDLENGYNIIRRKIISRVVNQVKKLLTASALVLCLLCANVVADEFKWVQDDVAFVSEACKTPNILFETANLYLTDEAENFVKSSEIWADAVQSGECVSIAPKRARVQLVMQVAFFENLHHTQKGIHGELWEVLIMEKGSSGDFEPTALIVYVGLYSKRFTWSSEPDKYIPHTTGA